VGAGVCVAQVSNLLYREASSLRNLENTTVLGTLPKSAMQQVGNLRYE
jgi:hypothetical protein